KLVIHSFYYQIIHCNIKIFNYKTNYRKIDGYLHCVRELMAIFTMTTFLHNSMTRKQECFDHLARRLVVSLSRLLIFKLLALDVDSYAIFRWSIEMTEFKSQSVILNGWS
ncbi:hypothetical protein L9F63_012607, partial [Diploptera punctata]